MAISDKTRKLLWGNAGGRCCLCRRKLIEAATQSDPHSVVGDECHIVSSAPSGPRAHTVHVEDFDAYENLILLCRNDHKLIDDQPETYTIELLLYIKAVHEKWVHSSLSDSTAQSAIPPLKSAPSVDEAELEVVVLHQLRTGKEAFAVTGNANSFLVDYEPLDDEADVELVGGMLQELQDWGDLFSDLDISQRIKSEFGLTGRLKELDEAGFYLFGAVQKGLFRIDGKDIAWPNAVFEILRKSNKRILGSGDSKVTLVMVPRRVNSFH